MDFTLGNAIFIAGIIFIAGLIYIIFKKFEIWDSIKDFLGDDIAKAIGHAWVAFVVGFALIYIATNNLLCPIQANCPLNPCGSGWLPGELACQANYQLTISACNTQIGAQISACHGFMMITMGVGFLLVFIGGAKVGWNILT